MNEVRFQSAITIKTGKKPYDKTGISRTEHGKIYPGAVAAAARKLDVLDLDDEAADCERMHEQAEALYQKLSARFGIQDGE